MIFCLSNSFVYKENGGVLAKTPISSIKLDDKILIASDSINGLRTSCVSEIFAKIIDDSDYLFNFLCNDELFEKVISISEENNSDKVFFSKVNGSRIPTNTFLYNIGKHIAEESIKNSVPKFFFDLVLKNEYLEIPTSFALGFINHYNVSNEFYDFFKKAVKESVKSFLAHDDYSKTIRNLENQKVYSIKTKVGIPIVDNIVLGEE